MAIDQEGDVVRALRYVGRHRNAGYGYSFVQRARRELSYFVAHRLGLYRLGYLIDFDRDRYLEEYFEMGDWEGDTFEALAEEERGA